MGFVALFFSFVWALQGRSRRGGASFGDSSGSILKLHSSLFLMGMKWCGRSNSFFRRMRWKWVRLGSSALRSQSGLRFARETLIPYRDKKNIGRNVEVLSELKSFKEIVQWHSLGQCVTV